MSYNGAYAHVGSNTGIRATFNALGNPAPGTWWISQSFPNGLWAQVGYTIVGWFFEVWDLNAYKMLKNFKVTNQKDQAIEKGVHVFEISRQGGHGRWAFLADGKTVGAYGIGADTGNGDFFLTNEFSTGAENGLFTDAMMLNSSWQPAPSGSAYLQDTPSLGIVGHLQDSSLAPGSVRIGGPALTPSGAALW